MFRRRLAAAVTAALVPAVLVASLAVAAPTAAGAQGRAATAAHPVVLYSSDGMRPDLMQRFAAGGRMPTYASLMRAGATGDNGLTQGFPPNTGQGWYTLATGAYPGVHGSTNNTFFDTRQTFTSPTSFSFHGNGASPGTDPTNVLEAQSVASSAELAGKQGRPARVDGRAEREHQRPDRRLRHELLPARRAGVPARTRRSRPRAAKFGLSYQVASFTPATGWTNVPASALPAQQALLTVPSTLGRAQPRPHVRPVRLRPRQQRLRPRAGRPDDRGQGRRAVGRHAGARPVLARSSSRGANGLIGAAAGRDAPASTSRS